MCIRDSAESVEKDGQGVAGVSLNEEGINLMTYNKAYQALGRLMTTMDEPVSYTHLMFNDR